MAAAEQPMIPPPMTATSGERDIPADCATIGRQ
jgi:hypothetical protein